MTARRTRRTNSSLFPENITPAITSIQPGRVPWNIAVLTAWRRGVWETGPGKGSEQGSMGQGNPDILRICGVVPHIVAVLCGFCRATPQKRAEFQGFSLP